MIALVNPTVAWVLLFVAALFEVAWAGTMKLTEGFTRLGPSILNLACMACSVILIENVVKVLPVGTAYAVWTGIGAVGAMLIGIFIYHEPASALRILFLLMIVAGIVGLNLTGQSAYGGSFMAVICFDYDGVIADTLALESEYYIDIYKQNGVYIFETGEDLRNACRGNFYEFCEEYGLNKEFLDHIFAEYNRYLEEHEIEVPLFEGIPALLRMMLEKHGVYIVSLNDADVIRDRLGEEGIDGFEDIIGWQQSTSKLETLRDMKEKYGDDLWFISDSIGDVREAVAAECPHILAVTYGWGDREDLADAGAHILFDTVAELRAYLEKI